MPTAAAKLLRRGRIISKLRLCALVFPAILVCSPVAAQQTGDPAPAPQQVTLNAAQLFRFADQARDAGDFATAEQAYRALSSNPDVDLRNEARFRLGMMLADRQKKYREAALEFRAILDEKPNVARVRLELARMQAMLGNLGAAEREFRAAEASGLPADVERIVRFYANALSARKPLGGSFEVAIAPDSNINSATRSNTLGTVIGDFTLNDDARGKSGIGLSLRGQSYLRHGIDSHATLLVRLSAAGDIYRQSAFDDYQLSLQAGPEYAPGKDRISIYAGPSWRWYGKQPYSASLGGGASWQHPLGNRTQLRVDGGITHITNRRNTLQTSDLFTLSAGLDRSFSARFGGGLQLWGSRDAARDPGYATASGGVSLYGFREMGRVTVVASLGYSHLEADQRLFLYPHRRIDDRYSASLAATFRSIRIGGFSPLARLRWDRNVSSVELYDFRRVSGELGLTSAF